MIECYNLSPNHQIVTEPDHLQRMVSEFDTVSDIGVDFETSGLQPWNGDHIIGAALGYQSSSGEYRCFYLPVLHRTNDRQASLDRAKEAFKDCVSKKKSYVGHHFKFDLNMARFDGWYLDPWTDIHDTQVQAYLLDENRYFGLEKVVASEFKSGGSPYGDPKELKDAVENWLVQQAKRCRLGKREYLLQHGHEEVPVGLEAEYACRDVGHTLALHAAQYRRATGAGEAYEKQRNALYINEMLLVRALADIEFVGQKVDVDYLERAALSLDRDLECGSEKLQKAFGRSINWNNDNHIRELLFDDLKLPVFDHTIKGKPSVDRMSLTGLLKKHEGIQMLLDWRERYKTRSTYTDSLVTKVDPNNRIHTSFLQVGTATGRLSSRDPNLQNIPSRNPELSRLVRKAFVVDEHMARIYCDYSQIELRMLAWITQCPTLLRAYKSKAYDSYIQNGRDYDRYIIERNKETSTDVHGIVAERVFGKRTKANRSAAKVINFGVPYGAGPNLLMVNPQLRLSERNAKKLFKQYHEQNPEINVTKKKLFRKMRRMNNQFVNWAGRARHGPRLSWNRRDGANCPVSEEERSMFASLVQGSAGELTRYSLVKLWWLQQKGQIPAITTSTIHDEIQVDCSKADVIDVAKIVRREMENFPNLFGSTPVIADVEITVTNWAEKKEVHL